MSDEALGSVKHEEVSERTAGGIWLMWLVVNLRRNKLMEGKRSKKSDPLAGQKGDKAGSL